VFGSFALVSWHEGERHSTRVSIAIALGCGLIFTGFSLLPAAFQIGLLVLIGCGVLAGFALFLRPVGRVDLSRDTPRSRFDERDVMFARCRLVPGSPEYQAYYAMRPKNKAGDDQTRSRPGLLSLEASQANPFLFASPQGSFTLTEALHAVVNGPVSKWKFTLDAREMTAYIKSLARYYGALDVGITILQPYHVYSHIGRGSGIYGTPIPVEQRFAVAFTVEMDYAMIGANPAAQGVVESAKEYVEVACIAVQLAAAIRNLGYPARAHIDGDYRLICPLVARDAGLGEIGRMGILMTPRQGPRVRLGVVTTDLELLCDPSPLDAALIDFCTICEKCAENCPPKAIPFGGRQEIDGALRWQINADTCFRYWTMVGTDCGRCMTVCPYSHPDNIYHNLIRWGNTRSGAFRRLALWMDNLFYGERPIPREAPRWTRL